MFPYWMVLLLMSGFVLGICEPSSRHIAKKKDIPRGFYSKQMDSNTGKKHFAFLKRNKVSMFDRVSDQPIKQGSFKIDDGKVIGGGIYDINKDGVSIDLKIKIAPDYIEPKAQPTPASTTGQTPGGSKTTAAPVASKVTSQTTSSPGVTTVPGVSEATAAPGGGSVTTSAPTGSNKTTPSSTGTTAAPSGTTPSSSTGSDIEKEALELHNKFRAVHDAPAMTLNAQMSQSAATYAQTLANLGTLQHASQEERDNNGENLSYGCSSSTGQTATEAVTNWYNEICDPGYTFGSENMGGAGHFTQLVWKESVELGFGKADSEQNGMKCTYYVARYKKAGNMQGSFAENVIKGSFDQSYCSTI